MSEKQGDSRDYKATEANIPDSLIKTSKPRKGGIMRLGNVSKCFLFVIFIFCSLPIGAIAETTMHCGMRLVEVGDKKAEVLDTCGEPLIRDIIGDKTAWTERKHQGKVVKGTAMTISVERWTYSFGPNRFSRILTFYGDELVKIELGEKLKR